MGQTMIASFHPLRGGRRCTADAIAGALQSVDSKEGDARPLAGGPRFAEGPLLPQPELSDLHGVHSSLNVRELLPSATWEQVRRALKHEPFRRLSHTPELSEVPLDVLCQSMHIARPHGDARRLLGGARTGYYQHSLASSYAEIDELIDLGIRSLYLQLYPDPYDGPERAIAHHTAVTAELRRRYGSGLTLAVDTAGLCMGTDLRWGVRDVRGEIDAESTLDVLATAAAEVAQAGADAVVTVGRVNFEAQVARAAIDRVRPEVQLWAFSTNSETPNAYFETTAVDPSKALTGQKLLVGNGTEMTLRALRDCHEGVDVLIQKPMENLAVLAELRSIADSDPAREAFLARPRTRDLIQANRDLFADGLFSSAQTRGRLDRVRLGAYEVSGTYSIFRLIEDAYSEVLAFAMLDELYRNAVAAAGDRCSVLISRSMLWYASGRRKRQI
jgi:porphobilinogen synthase